MSQNPPTFLARLSGLAAVAALAGLLFWLSLALDQTVYRHVWCEEPLRRDWARMFRSTGYLPTWIIAAGALWAIDARPSRSLAWESWRRGGFLLASAGGSGLVAEALKLLVRRERPAAPDSVYVFRPWEGRWWSTSDLGFPSSHAAVGFGAAAALCCLFPRAWPAWLVLSAGCSLTRVLDRAHYLSDCAGAALAAGMTVLVLMLIFRRLNARRAETSGR